MVNFYLDALNYLEIQKGGIHDPAEVRRRDLVKTDQMTCTSIIETAADTLEPKLKTH